MDLTREHTEGSHGLMIYAPALLLALVAPLQRDTTVVLGSVNRDLTGDGKPETLRLAGTGRSVDSMQFTFTIDDAGRTIYRAQIHLPPRSEYDRDARSRRMDYHAWLKDDVGKYFFDERKFRTPSGFVAMLREHAESHTREIASVIARDRSSPPDFATANEIWNEIQRSGVTTFEFSQGGDAFTVIAWSVRDQRFYRLIECC